MSGILNVLFGNKSITLERYGCVYLFLYLLASFRKHRLVKQLDVKVVTLPDGKDPDDVIKEGGGAAFKELLFSAKPLIDFKLDVVKNAFDVNTLDGKRKYITNAIRVIRESSSPAEQEDLLKTVRDVTGTTFETLKRELYSVEEKPIEKPQEVMQFTDNAGDKMAIASRYVLASYLFNKPYAGEFDIAGVEFDNPVYQSIKNYIQDCAKEGKRAKFSDLYEALGTEANEELSRIAGLETDENKAFDQAEYFFDRVRTLKENKITKDLEKLTDMFSKETDNEKRRTYAAEMAKLLAEKNRLK